MKDLKISKDIKLPINTVTQKLAWLGTTGSGKTYGASKLAEEFWYVGAQFVVIDPVGVWYGLRLSKDGKKPSNINIPIFGGLHGDVPLESTGGELIANLVVDKELSCIIDVSQFESDTEKARFATDFANKLFFRKKASPSAMHLFLEECQEFVPQNPQKGEERMLHAFVRMQKLGRNFGIGSSYISQRPQEVNKKALNMCQTLFVFRTTGTHERTAIEKWIEDKSLDESIANDLPKIETGHCHVWSPEFLKISEMAHISEKDTFNASATPEVGAIAKARHLAPIDLDKVRSEMAATIEKAKGEDPKELKKRIAELEKINNLKTKPSPIFKAVAEDVFNKKAKELLATNNRKWERIVKSWQDYAEKCLKALRSTVYEGNRHFDILDSHKPIVDDPKQDAIFYPNKNEVKSTTTPKPQAIDGNSDEEITGPEQKIINSVAWCEGLEIKPVNVLVAFIAGYSPYTSSYQQARGSLGVKGYIKYINGIFYFTEEGREKAETIDQPLSQEELQRAVLSKLRINERKVLQVLIDSYPEEVSNTDLANRAGYSEKTSSYQQARGSLGSFGLIKYENGMARAEDILFKN